MNGGPWLQWYGNIGFEQTITINTGGKEREPKGGIIKWFVKKYVSLDTSIAREVIPLGNCFGSKRFLCNEANEKVGYCHAFALDV